MLKQKLPYPGSFFEVFYDPPVRRAGVTEDWPDVDRCVRVRCVVFSRFPMLWNGEALVTACADVVVAMASLGACARKPQPARKAIMLTVVM